jgi:Fe(3+) dicitrate transport protein
VGTCTQSSGCDLSAIDTQFNAGEANIYGLESVVGGELRALGGVFSAHLSYTLTVGQFDTAFESGFSQWGQVESGDGLPYVPVHQGGGRLGYQTDRWGISASVKHVGDMRDAAGQGDIADADRIDAHTVVDGSAHINYSGARIYLTVDNLLDDPYLASRRPYGLRPGKRRQVMVGVKIGL